MNKNYLRYAVGCDRLDVELIKANISCEYEFNVINLTTYCILVESGEIWFETCYNKELSDSVILVGTNSMAQVLVGIAWELFLHISMKSNGKVWISTYSQQHLSKFGKVKPFKLNNIDGFIMNVDVLERMIS